MIPFSTFNKLGRYDMRYDKIATVPESWVQWRSDFYSGSRVSKKVLGCWEPFFIYIHGLKCDFMQKNCWKQSNFENLGSRAQKSPKIPRKKLAFNRDLLNFLGVWHILDDIWWILMSRRFRIYIANGSRESARPSYGRPKLTLISRERKICSVVFTKIIWLQF